MGHTIKVRVEDEGQLKRLVDLVQEMGLAYEIALVDDQGEELGEED